MKKLFLLLTLLLCTSMAWAHDVEVDGIYYNLNQTNKTATVTFKGSHYSSYDNEYSGEVVIPENFICGGITYSVTNIANRAFFNCSGLTSIKIPNSVTSIEDATFSGCSGLTSIEIPNSVTSIGFGAFYQCWGLTSVTIPNSVTNLGSKAFWNCSGLTSVTIGNSVAEISNYAFEYCTYLTNVRMLSSTPPTIGASVFGFTSLKTLYIPKGAAAAYNVQPRKHYEIVAILDSLNITDNGAAIYGLAEDAMKDIVTYTRNFTHTGWQALYVPFDIPYDAISDKFDVAELNNFHQFDDDNDGIFDRTELEVLRLRAGSTIEHHTPYVIRAKAAGEQTVAVSDVTAYRAEEKEFECMSLKRRYVFHGTYSGVSGADMLAGGFYALSNGELCRAASASAALGGFRWYVSVTDRATGLPVSPAALPAKMRIVEWGEEGGEVTGIAAAPADAPRTAGAPVYDLNGRRVGTADAMDALPKGVYIVNGKKAIR